VHGIRSMTSHFDGLLEHRVEHGEDAVGGLHRFLPKVMFQPLNIFCSDGDQSITAPPVRASPLIERNQGSRAGTLA
jgi:hypothetical protein